MKRELNYTGTIILSDDMNDHFNLGFASQNYGTFYSVFVNLTTEAYPPAKEQEDKEHNTKRLITIINLRIVNYIGNLNLGIKNAKVTVEELENDRKALIITPEIMVVSNENLDTDFNIFPTEMLETDSGMVKLYPDIYDAESRVLKTNDIVQMRRKLVSIYGKEHYDVPAASVGDDSFCHGIFDSEFYERAGSGKFGIKKKNSEPFYERRSVLQQFGDLEEELNEIKSKDASSRRKVDLLGGTSQLCYTGTSYIRVV